MGIFKELMGQHIHLSEVVNWESSPGDLKRAAKFHRNTTNYNASMTSSEVYGFLDLNEKVPIRDGDKVLQRVSGRLCVSSLVKFANGSSLIAEVHQAEPNGPTILVYPNTPEAEAIITNLIKNPAAFMMYYLPEIGVSSEFVEAVISKILDPALVHEAGNCKWVGESSTLLTPEELEDEEEGEGLEQQSWYVDVVKQMEELTAKEGGRKAKNYASAAALYDLDGEQLVKTMHEKNDGVINLEEVDDGATANEAGGLKTSDEDVSMLGEEDALDGEKSKTGSEEEDGGLQKGWEGAEAPNSKQSGDTPISGSVRFQNDVGDGTGVGVDDSSSVESMTPGAVPASAAGSSNSPFDAGISG
jgi:hypothetical protein